MATNILNKDYAIVLDSTTIPDDSVKGLVRIDSVPLTVTVGAKSKLENDWTIPEIVADYEKEPTHTSCPSPADFAKEYVKLFKDGVKDIVVIPMTQGISGTYQSAVIGKESLGDSQRDHVYVKDVKLANFGVANLLLALKPYLLARVTVTELANTIDRLSADSRLAFTLSDLHHLYSGGRLSKISFLIGMVLKIKPIIGISLQDGKLHAEKKCRTFNEVDNYFLDIIGEFYKKYRKVYVRYIDLTEEALRLNLEKKAAAKFPNLVTTAISEVGPLFTIHLGRSGYGLSVIGDDPIAEPANVEEAHGLRKLLDKIYKR